MSSENTKPHIVITGIGLVSPIGIGREIFWANLQAGKSGISRVDGYSCTATPGQLAAEVKDFDDSTPRDLFPKKQRKSAKVMCREIQFGAAAAILAVEDAGLDLEAIESERMGVEYGANLMYNDPEDFSVPGKNTTGEFGKFDFKHWGDKGLASMEPLWMLKYLPNMPACHIGIFTDSRGPNNSVTLDEASPGVALTEALNVMERGAADVMIVGGTGTRMHPMKAMHAHLWSNLGFDEQNPAASCKPFDANRNGQVVGESAGCLILETEAHAQARGAKIYGTFLGGGSSCVCSKDGTPNIKQAILNASRAALRRADMDASELGHVNAHGLGDVAGDAIEAEAINELCPGVPVVGLKGYFGNSGAATGFLEVAGSLLALETGNLPGTLNTTHPDETLGLDIVQQQRPVKNKSFLKINYTKLGQASAVVIRGV